MKEGEREKGGREDCWRERERVVFREGLCTCTCRSRVGVL